jgi:7-keto-8-aminopelargonate synthetase-like enzyme
MDKLNHSSLIAGVIQSKSRLIRFAHNNIQDACRVIEKNNAQESGLLIASDGVFSMDGDYANVKGLVTVKEKYDGVLMIDEAHSLGVFGKNGEGLVASQNLSDKVDLIMGTFSKSLASIGGFIAASNDVIHFLKHTSSPFIFSASMPPASVAAANAAIDIMLEEPERIEKLWKNTEYMHKGLINIGVKTSNGETPILPVIVGKDELAFKMCIDLQNEGIFVNPAVSPAVAPGFALIRLSLMSSHTFEEIDFVLDKIKYYSKQYGII